jgi:hypothetical protein
MSETVHLHDLPTSFGAFKPVGYLMLGVPQGRAVQAVAAALRQQGLADDALVPFTPAESEAEMTHLLGHASPISGFGYEIKLMARYVELSHRGHQWLLVRCPAVDAAVAPGTGGAPTAREGRASLNKHSDLPPRPARPCPTPPRRRGRVRCPITPSCTAAATPAPCTAPRTPRH